MKMPRTKSRSTLLVVMAFTSQPSIFPRRRFRGPVGPLVASDDRANGLLVQRAEIRSGGACTVMEHVTDAQRAPLFSHSCGRRMANPWSIG